MKFPSFLLRHIFITGLAQLFVWITLLAVLPSHIHGFDYRQKFAEFLNSFLLMINTDATLFGKYLLHSMGARWACLFALTFLSSYVVYRIGYRWTLHVYTVLLHAALAIFVSIQNFPTQFTQLIHLINSIVSEKWLFLPYNLIVLIPLIALIVATRAYFKLGFQKAILLHMICFASSMTLWGFFQTKIEPFAHNRQMTVLVVFDSLRADRLKSNFMPLTHRAVQNLPYVMGTLFPTSNATVPAFSSMMTGQLPYQSGVTSSYSPPQDLKDKSVISALSEKGFCTVAAAGYSASAISRNDLGFEFKTSSNSDRSQKHLSSFWLRKDPLLKAFLNSTVYPYFASEYLLKIDRLVSGKAELPSLISSINRLSQECGDRPAVAVIFAQEPHFEYPIHFPIYLDIPTELRNFSLLSDFYSNPNKSSYRSSIGAHYNASIRQLDSLLAETIAMNADALQAGKLSLIVSSDHGEYLGEEGFFLHAEEFGPYQPLLVPLLILGKKLPIEIEDKTLSGTALASLIHSIATDTKFKTQSLSLLYQESEIWPWGSSQNQEQIRYPKAWEGLLSFDKDGVYQINQKYLELTNSSKVRRWLYDGALYTVTPKRDGGFLYSRDGQVITFDDLPGQIRLSLNSIMGARNSAQPAPVE